MEKYIVWILLAVCVGAHLWMMRKGHHHDDHDDHGHDDDKKVNLTRKISQENNEKFYHCEECGMRYRDRSWAEKCEAWCKEHHTCNLEIIQHAVESGIVKQNT